MVDSLENDCNIQLSFCGRFRWLISVFCFVLTAYFYCTCNLSSGFIIFIFIFFSQIWSFRWIFVLTTIRTNYSFHCSRWAPNEMNWIHRGDDDVQTILIQSQFENYKRTEELKKANLVFVERKPNGTTRALFSCARSVRLSIFSLNHFFLGRLDLFFLSDHCCFATVAGFAVALCKSFLYLLHTHTLKLHSTQLCVYFYLFGLCRSRKNECNSIKLVASYYFYVSFAQNESKALEKNIKSFSTVFEVRNKAPVQLL